MHASIAVLALGAVSAVAASSSGCPFSGTGHKHQIPEGVFMPAKSTDVRSPCPMLNVLANHGYLPRDGKNISKNITRTAMKNGLNIHSDFSDLMFDPALLTNPQAGATTFDLDHLNRHNILEHDGSLSRADAYWDDTQVFNQTVYAEYLGYFNGSDMINTTTAAYARLARMIYSRDTNPSFYLNDTSESISFGETAAYILALGNGTTGTVRMDRVKVMFEEERLPVELGWSAPTVAVTAQDLYDVTHRVINETVWPAGIKARADGGIHAGIIKRRL